MRQTLTARFLHRIDVALERYLPEKRLFLRSEQSTRFVRLSPLTQAAALSGTTALVAWTMVASSILLIDQVGSGNIRDQARREQALYDSRLNAIAAERDRRAEAVRQAQDRFNLALDEVSKMQSALLASEERRRELETGMTVLQATLRRTLAERDAAQDRSIELAAQLAGETGPADGPRPADLEQTLTFLTAALDETSAERDKVAEDAASAYEMVQAIAYERELDAERNDQIFTSLEEALTVSMTPLDKMFKAAGLNTKSILNRVRQGYSGVGGPLTPLSVSSKGSATELSPDEIRARAIMGRLDEINMYRIAAEKLPFAQPLKSSYRLTSPFGRRTHPTLGGSRMHEGTDMASAYGTPIYSTADGVVVRAQWVSGYGRMVEIRHEFGIVTRYGHMSKIRVKAGQRVSRGDRIGDMGNSGRSTGTHLHYEVRVDGKPVNPMTYIKAARNVF
ncbi:peptidoglycan DD-metalloendopeptidase family protein [Rhodovulum sulfidophilum]|nr:M23 family metallopeptidase [Rhodovulum sulfidophilum]MBL3550838.1 peptidoglycan DD-metalloendopeptidase family protein [Rhodovulum sulfidophilum]OLS48502.1 peptidase M23 [Rhodovulum sulfidophilum]